MFKSVFVSMILVAGVSQAADTERTIQLLERKADEVVANGYTGRVRYNVSTFNAAKEMRDMKKEYAEKYAGADNCKFNFESSRRKNIELMTDTTINTDASIPAILRRMYRDGQIKAIHSATWDGASGDSEYCSVYEFVIWTVDGLKLRIEFNHTD